LAVNTPKNKPKNGAQIMSAASRSFMNNWASRLIGWLAGLGAIAAMFYKSKAATEKAKREAEKAEYADERADRATHTADTYQNINTERAELEQQHQQEQLNDETSIDGRDHFNNRFK
jgi:hypothetical protein